MWYTYSSQFKTAMLKHLLLLQPEEATEPTSALVPFLQKYSDARSKKPSVSVSRFSPLELLQPLGKSAPPPLSSGAEAGIEGNQRTAGPSVPFHELPEAGRGRPRAPVLPGSRWERPKHLHFLWNKPRLHKIPRINVHILNSSGGCCS